VRDRARRRDGSSRRREVSMTTIRVLSPVAVSKVTQSAPLPLPTDLSGRRIGLLDNTKATPRALGAARGHLRAEGQLLDTGPGGCPGPPGRPGSCRHRLGRLRVVHVVESPRRRHPRASRHSGGRRHHDRLRVASPPRGPRARDGGPAHPRRRSPPGRRAPGSGRRQGGAGGGPAGRVARVVTAASLSRTTGRPSLAATRRPEPGARTA